MGDPQWWDRRRFGMMVDLSLATVPAWAPVGEQAGWYLAHIDGATRDTYLHPSPIVETLHHHHERWAHVERYDDFFPFLHFEQFDPDEWTSLARDAGMSYAVMTAKHHDGLCWWDAPNTDRTVLHDGPARNVLGQFAAACEHAGLTFGTSYSLLDWSDPRYPGTEYVDDVLHPHVLDLVNRYGARLLWGSGQWGAGGDHWRSAELHAAARRLTDELLIDDRWWADVADVRTFEHRLPDDIVDASWEFRRPLGASSCYNRAETPERLLSAPEIAALLTEVVAKGGHLLIEVGPDASGRMPDAHADRLRAAGGWIRRHQRLVDHGRPWSTWGDADTRMIVVDDELHAVDVSGQGCFRALASAAGKVAAVTGIDGTHVGFEQTDEGLQLLRPPRRAQRMPAVYRVELEPPPEAPIALFPDATDADTPSAVELAPLLTDAEPGDIVQLGDGTHAGPVRIPDGVTVRGLGPARTLIDGNESTGVTLGVGSRLEHCRVAGGGSRIGRLPRVAARVAGRDAVILGCRIDGHVAIDAGSARLISCRGAGVVAHHADHVEVVRSTFDGMGTDVGIDIVGGGGHLVDSCELRGHLAAIVFDGTVGASVRHNRMSARWWGVQLRDTDSTSVAGNAVEQTMRAVDVDGGTDVEVVGNAAADGDSGCVLQGGTANAEVTGNYWERCRVGLIAWGAGQFRSRDNACAGLNDPDGDQITGP